MTRTLIILALLTSPIAAQSQPRAMAEPGKVHEIPLTMIPGCKAFWDYESGWRIWESGDLQARVAFFSPRYKSGDCTLFMRGEEVMIQDSMRTLNGERLICLRYVGQAECFWTAYIIRP